MQKCLCLVGTATAFQTLDGKGLVALRPPRYKQAFPPCLCQAACNVTDAGLIGLNGGFTAMPNARTATAYAVECAIKEVLSSPAIRDL